MSDSQDEDDEQQDAPAPPTRYHGLDVRLVLQVQGDWLPHRVNKAQAKSTVQISKATASGALSAADAAKARGEGIAKGGALTALDTLGGAGTIISLVVGGVDTAKGVLDAHKEHHGKKEVAKTAVAEAAGQLHPVIGFVRDTCGLIQIGVRVATGTFDHNQLAKMEQGFTKVDDTIRGIETLAADDDSQFTSKQVASLRALADALKTELQESRDEVYNSEHYKNVHAINASLLGKR